MRFVAALVLVGQVRKSFQYSYSRNYRPFQFNCLKMSTFVDNVDEKPAEADNVRTEALQQNYRGVMDRINEATSNTIVTRPNGVSLIAVSKTKPVEDLMAIYDVGHRDFGENYFQELCTKSETMPDDIKWHFIGHLQSQKAGPIVKMIPGLVCVETVDSIKLATKLNTACQSYRSEENHLNIFLQVNTSGEESKSGVPPIEVGALALEIVEKCPRLKIEGLMTIGAPGDSSCFDRLVECRKDVAVQLGVEENTLELSMGMSGDFEEAIAKGSTRVRVGSTIFGARNYPNKA